MIDCNDYYFGQPQIGKLLVLPKSAAKQFTSDSPWAAISIGFEPGDWPKLNKCQQVGLLQLAFADIEFPRGDYILFSEEHAKQIWDFVEKVWDKCELLLVHCLAGVSRSPAVAAAIAKVQYGDDNAYFHLYCPNSLVYRTLLNYKFSTSTLS